MPSFKVRGNNCANDEVEFWLALDGDGDVVLHAKRGLGGEGWCVLFISQDGLHLSKDMDCTNLGLPFEGPDATIKVVK